MDLPFHIVDVFAERPLEGNQLAVVFPPRPLDAGQMLAIAREIGFSETTFVTANGEVPDVRIFTPADELPFAGHPVLGTAAVLRTRQGGNADRLALRLPASTVEVRFAADGIVWLSAPPATRSGECDRAETMRRLGLREEQLTIDPFVIWDVGARFLLIELSDLDALSNLSIDRAFFSWLRLNAGANGVFAFTSDAYGPEAHYAARMLFMAGGVREDAATGSAGVCLAAHLRESGRDPGDIVEVEQGYEIQRPSRIYLKIGEHAEVGGRVFEVGEGVLRVGD